MEKGQKPSWTFIFGIVSQLFFASVLATSEVAFHKDGVDQNYASLLKECKKIKLPNGTVIQTVPKLLRTPLVTACSTWKSKYGPPLTQAVCRFPGSTRPTDAKSITPSDSTLPVTSPTSTSGPLMTTAKVFVTDRVADVIFVSEMGDTLNFTSIPSTSRPYDIKYDPTERHVYWGDWNCNCVYRANLDGEDREQVTAARPTWYHRPYGIAIAERSRILYIAYYVDHKVKSMSIERGSPLPGTLSDFVNRGIFQTRALVIDEEEGFLYISRNYGIVRALLNATNDIEEIYQSTDLWSFTGLSIDLTKNPRRIFFLDTREQRAFYKDLNSAPNSDISTAIELTNFMHPYQETLGDISYFDGILYWVKASYPIGIGIITDYDQTNRSYKVQEISQFQDPWRILITSIEP